jgi:hypothetical protein
MYEQTTRQLQAEATLKAQGFRFSNWIAAQPDAEGNPLTETMGTMVFTKRGATRFGREYREVEPDGSIH